MTREGIRAALARRRAGTMGRTLNVAAGLAVLAVTAYITLILAGRLLGAAEFAGLAALYVLLSSVPVGLFLPLEQEVARRRGRERVTREVEATLLRRAIGFAMCLCLVVVALALALRGATLRLLGGDAHLLAAFCVALPGYALCYVSRGALSGNRRLGRYGLQLSVEGTFRLLGLVALALVGARSAAAFGWLFGLAPWVALAVSLAGLRPAATRDRAARDPDADRTVHPLVAPLMLLLASSLAAQLLVGAGPVSAQLFATPEQQAGTGAFFAALVVVRVPVFLFTAVQPSMLPALAAHASAGRRAAFGSLLRKVFAAMGLLALVTNVGTVAFGPWALRVLFGPGFDLSRGLFLLMGASVVLFLAATVLGQAVLALGRHRHVAAGWLTGLVGLAVGTFLPDDPVGKAAVGLLGGAAAASAAFTVMLWWAMRTWRPTVAESGAAEPGTAAPAPASAVTPG